MALLDAPSVDRILRARGDFVTRVLEKTQFCEAPPCQKNISMVTAIAIQCELERNPNRTVKGAMLFVLASGTIQGATGYTSGSANIDQRSRSEVSRAAQLTDGKATDHWLTARKLV